MKRQIVKKASILALAGAMTAGLAACGGSAAADQTASSQSADAGNSVAEVEWFSDVTGWGPSGWTSGVETSPLMDAITEKTGLALKLEQPPTDADTKVGLMIASGDLPDMISLTDADTIKQLIQSGKVWQIEEFLQTYDPESHLLTDFPEDIKEAVVYKYGGWYSLPSHLESEDMRQVYPLTQQAYLDNVTKGHNSSIMFNKTIMDALGITQEDVQTEEGFYAACEKVKNSGYTVDGQPVLPVVLHANLWINSSLDGIIRETFGVAPVDEEGAYRHLEMAPGYKNALKFVNNLIQDGYLDVNVLTLDEAALKTYVEGGRVFCWIGNPAQSSKKEQIPFVSYGPILASNGAKPVAGINLSAGSGWIQTFISKDCENPEQIAKMLSFATSREGLTLNEYGVEGVDFNFDENGVAVRTEEGQKRYEDDYAKNITLWPFANTDYAWSTQAAPEEGTDAAAFNQVSTAMGKYEDTYIYNSDLISFTSGNVIEPSSDLGIKLSQVDNYLESQKAKIVSASTDEAFETEYQNMIDTLNSYSIEEIDAEYDKYLQESCQRLGEKIEDVNAALYK
ncbi:MAG: extracellular solute-binding protein [Eubacteriales bacterium]|nr:extracellular solute-binding protein [Eubacteriales bacterium]